MEQKDFFGSFAKKISWLSSKNFISDIRLSIDEAFVLLSQGKAETVRDKMLEVVDLCDKRQKDRDKDFWWVYAMSQILTVQAFYQFGKLLDFPALLRDAKRIADANNFVDVKYWILRSELTYFVKGGRVSDIARVSKELEACIPLLKEQDFYRSLVLPLYAEAAIDCGAYDQAQQLGSECLCLASTLNSESLKVEGYYILGKVEFDSYKFDEALKYFERADDLSRKKNFFQHFFSLYGIARVKLAEMKIEESKNYCEQLLNRMKNDFELSETVFDIKAKRLEARVKTEEEKYQEAESLLREALLIARNNDNEKDAGKIYLDLARVYQADRNYHQAVLSVDEACQCFGNLENEFLLVKAKSIMKELKSMDYEVKNSAALSEKKAERFLSQEDASAGLLRKVGVLDYVVNLSLGKLDLNIVLKDILNYAIDCVGAERGFIVLIDDKGELYGEIERMIKSPEKGEPELFRGYSRIVLDKMMIPQGVRPFAEIREDLQKEYGKALGPVISIPLRTPEGENVVGLIYLDRRLSANPFLDEDLKLIDFLMFYSSMIISKSRIYFSIQNKVENMQEQLIQSEKMATIGILAGGVAHEINTPLGTILNNTELLMMDEMNDDQRECLEMIKKGTLRCKTIVDQLLKYSRKTRVEFEDVDVNAVVNEACIILEHQFSIQGVNIQKDLSAVPRIRGNGTELSQVITNLLVNARDAIVERGISPENKGVIVINTRQDDLKILIQITDNGCGIAEDALPKIYDPFYTSKGVGKGTGLGLSIVQKIVEKHGGLMDVKSEVNVGTVISIKFLV